MKTMLQALALVLSFSSLALAPIADAQYFSPAGHWETDASAVNGRGAGHLSVDIVQSGTGLRWSAANGGLYVCTLRGYQCSGTWSGTTGSGWFDVSFSPDASSFYGVWGYGEDRSSSGAWSGHR
ncbi:MAG: hypothetical protein U0234_13250 [Sandaracinus sp.]